MAKGKAVNNKQEAMGPPMTRGSRKRGYPVEKMTEDDHQDMGDSNTEDTLVQCLKSPEEEGDKKCIEPLESSSSSDRNTYEKNEDSETPEVPTACPKRQFAIRLSACGDESIKKKIEQEKQVPNECDPLDDSNKYIDVNAGMKLNGSEEQMSAVDNHHKLETNQELDEVKQISIEPVVEGLAKKRRRMGMCRLSENQLNLFLRKCGNRAEKSERRNKNTVEAEEKRGSSVEVLSPQQQATEIMSHHNNREETIVETSANGTTMVCEPLSTEMHVSEDDPMGDPMGGLITKHYTHVEEGLQRTEPECQMTVGADGAVPVCESILNVCKFENTKDSDQSMGNHHCAKLTRGIIESQDETLNNLCKDQTEPAFIQASDQRPEMEHQQNKTKTEAHTTVSVCDASSPDLPNGKRAQKPHLDKEQQSETEVHLTAKIADSVCVLQNPELQTTKVHLAGPPEPAALLNEEKQMNEQDESQKATFSKIHKQCENKYTDGDNNHSENCNVKMNPTEETPIEKEPPHQPDTYKMSMKILPQVIGENPYLMHTSVSDTTPETNCSENSHMMKCNCEENKLHDTNSSTVNMETPEWREYVSDSQLNTIDMTHPVMAGGSEGPPDCYEDVTDRVGGLIRELSFLNRTVMATHRELETLRRRGKNSKNCH